MSSLRNTGVPINFDDPITGNTAPARIPVSRLTDLSELSSLVKDGLLPPGYVGGFSSRHPGGANFLYGAASVRLLSQKIGMVQKRPFSGNTRDLSADPDRSRVNTVRHGICVTSRVNDATYFSIRCYDL